MPKRQCFEIDDDEIESMLQFEDEHLALKVQVHEDI